MSIFSHRVNLTLCEKILNPHRADITQLLKVLWSDWCCHHFVIVHEWRI